jgi:hypoxanthine phosphoribosyltransferase
VKQILPLYSAESIATRIREMAREMVPLLHEETLCVSLLRGGFMFTADLIRALSLEGVHPMIDFMTLSSYGAGTESSGTVTVNRDISEAVAGRDLLLIDDILESGRTLHFAQDLMTRRGAKSLRTAVLLEKPGKRKVEVQADHVGFTIPDHFVVGYGMDHANRYRELPYIGYIEG